MLSRGVAVGFIPATDLGRAREFYGEVLGLDVVSANEFAVVVEAGGVRVRVTDVGPKFVPQQFTVFGWEVGDVHAEVRELTGRGVSFLDVPGIAQDADLVWAAPDGSLVAWFHDPEGNTLSLNGH